MSAAVGASLFCVQPPNCIGTGARTDQGRQNSEENELFPFFSFFFSLFFSSSPRQSPLPPPSPSSSLLPSLPCPLLPAAVCCRPFLPPAFISLQLISIATANPARVHSQTRLSLFLSFSHLTLPFVQSGIARIHCGLLFKIL